MHDSRFPKSALQWSSDIYQITITNGRHTQIGEKNSPGKSPGWFVVSDFGEKAVPKHVLTHVIACVRLTGTN